MIREKEDLPKNLDERLHKVAGQLLLNAYFINNSGIAKGKLGIAIFMYHYARYNGSRLYEEFADNLIDEISEGINTSTPLDFENGLTGIGWGISYLVRNGFIEGDIDEILEEIDITLSHKLNESLPGDKFEKKNESGYHTYLKLRRNLRKWHAGNILSFINPQNHNNKRISVSDLVNPDYYGLFYGIAGTGMIILNKIKYRRIKISNCVNAI